MSARAQRVCDGKGSQVVMDLRTPEAVEQMIRPVAMLPPQAPAFDRERAIEVLQALAEAMRRPT